LVDQPQLVVLGPSALGPTDAHSEIGFEEYTELEGISSHDVR